MGSKWFSPGHSARRPWVALFGGPLHLCPSPTATCSLPDFSGTSFKHLELLLKSCWGQTPQEVSLHLCSWDPLPSSSARYSPVPESATALEVLVLRDQCMCLPQHACLPPLWHSDGLQPLSVAVRQKSVDVFYQEHRVAHFCFRSLSPQASGNPRVEYRQDGSLCQSTHVWGS